MKTVRNCVGFVKNGIDWLERKKRNRYFILHFTRDEMEIKSMLGKCGCNNVNMNVPDAVSVFIDEDTLTVKLDDGRTVSAPVAWYPRLLHASKEERANWRLIGKGHGIHWENVDEDISVEGILAGKSSGESQASLKKWLQSRMK